MLNEIALHRLVILLTVRVLLMQGIYADSPEPMMYKLRRGNELEIRHLAQVPNCESVAQLKTWIVECFKSTNYPIEKGDQIQVDLYHNNVFEAKHRLASMVRSSNEDKAKIQLFMSALQVCVDEMKASKKILLATQKKEAS